MPANSMRILTPGALIPIDRIKEEVDEAVEATLTPQLVFPSSAKVKKEEPMDDGCVPKKPTPVRHKTVARTVKRRQPEDFEIIMAETRLEIDSAIKKYPFFKNDRIIKQEGDDARNNYIPAFLPIQNSLVNQKPVLAANLDQPEPKNCTLPMWSMCQLCDRRFGSQHSLDAHIKSQHVGEKRGRKRPNVHKKVPKKKSSKTYKCGHCDKTYKSYQTFYKHRNIHEERYKCEACGRCCDSSASLDKHRDVHSGPIYSCKFCQVGYRSKRGLTRHENTCKRKNTVGDLELKVAVSHLEEILEERIEKPANSRLALDEDRMDYDLPFQMVAVDEFDTLEDEFSFDEVNTVGPPQPVRCAAVEMERFHNDEPQIANTMIENSSKQHTAEPVAMAGLERSLNAIKSEIEKMAEQNQKIVKQNAKLENELCILKNLGRKGPTNRSVSVIHRQPFDFF